MASCSAWAWPWRSCLGPCPHLPPPLLALAAHPMLSTPMSVPFFCFAVCLYLSRACSPLVFFSACGFARLMSRTKASSSSICDICLSPAAVALLLSFCVFLPPVLTSLLLPPDFSHHASASLPFHPFRHALLHLVVLFCSLVLIQSLSAGVVIIWWPCMFRAAHTWQMPAVTISGCMYASHFVMRQSACARL